MSFAAYLQLWVEEAPVLAASILAVLFMAGIAAALGFRSSARLDETELQRLAAAEGASLDRFVLAADGKSALARLDDGRLLIARVMGADIGARALPASAARFRFRNGRFNVAFADTGFPPLDLAIDETPPWLARLAAGEAS